VFRVPPLGGCGGFSRTTWLVNEPQPPKGGTLNTVCRCGTLFPRRLAQVVFTIFYSSFSGFAPEHNSK
jgi:hypothetical protein